LAQSPLPDDSIVHTPDVGAAAAADPVRDADAPSTGLDFADNRLLLDLCGAHDSHLVRIEKATGAVIARRGNHISLHGDADVRARAAEALLALWRRLEEGRGVEPGDIDAALRFGAEAVPAPADAAAANAAANAPARQGQLEMFAGGDLSIRTRKKIVEPRTVAQRDYVRALLSRELVFGIGPAGTGKTYLAVAAAVSMFLEGQVDRIVLSRPAVEAGERLGFLPGDMKEKIDPYMQPLYDALNDLIPPKQVQKYIEEGRIEIAPLAFMRGRTLSNACVVLDEAQNTTEMQMKMFLTRMGEGSHMSITGDVTQIDLPRGIPSGLVTAERVLNGVEGIGFVKFTAEDVVRHPMVARIIKAYAADAGPERERDARDFRPLGDRMR
jgi:phosphate starvation-inducible PhoH-like protein